MSGLSSIEWTDATWNPVRGCSRVSEGCRNCYAERVAARFSTFRTRRQGPFAGFAEQTSIGPRWTGRVALIPEALDWPLRRRKPLRIFVNSMSDLFHESLPDEAIAAVFGVMLMAEQHTFQVLTKRPERMRRWFDWIATNPVHFGATRETAKRYEVGPAASCLAILATRVTEKMVRGPLFTAVVVGGAEPPQGAPIRSLWPLPNVWLGVSVENQATADERIPILLQTPAAHRFISAEPLLGPVSFDSTREGDPCASSFLTPIDGGGDPDDVALDWVIAGGESGPGARPCDVGWIRSIVAQCRAAVVPCFVKQLGRVPAGTCEHNGAGQQCRRLDCGPRFKSSKGGEPSEWPEDLRVRQVPA